MSDMLNGLSALAVAAMPVGIIGLFYVGALFTSQPVLLAIQIAAAILMISARIAFGIRSFHATANPTRGGVVSVGPYRYLRHPIYSAVIYFTAAGVAAHLSVPAVALFGLVVAGAVVRMLAEEHLLVQRYPEYRDYMRRTARVIPFVA